MPKTRRLAGRALGTIAGRENPARSAGAPQARHADLAGGDNAIGKAHEVRGGAPLAREVLLLIGEGDIILWSDASDSPVALPDSRARWEAIWSRREQIVEIAHSHPHGPEAFSHEDETTMAALATALGRAVVFSVVAPRRMIRTSNAGKDFDHVEDEPWWAGLLRLASGMKEK